MNKNKTGKVNLFEVGDLVKHKENDILIFEVVSILPSPDLKKSDCLYECQVGRGPAYKYHEQDLEKVGRAADQPDTT